MFDLCFKMGQQISMSRKNRRKSHKLFNSQIFMNGNNTLSHTFAVYDEESKVDRININSATENQLLRASEIDVELARNIVKHRKTIGYYQRVEDLVVVPGMGAERLERIKHQVCTSSKTAMRSSCQSFDSLKSVDSRTTITKSNKLVNVNVASVFELQLVHGITQEIAAAIVYYRNKKGPFKKLEDLRKIKCIDYIRQDNISRYLTVENDEDDISDPESDQHSHELNLNGYMKTNEGALRYVSSNGGISISNGLLASALSDIFDLLSAYSPRPIGKEIFGQMRNDKSAYRVCSWNLENFTIEKAANLGVKEVVCRTILENGFSIIVLQDIVDEGALKVICDEMNKPKLRRVEEWKTNSYHWKYNIYASKEKNLGFIYDARRVDSTKPTSSEKGPPELDSDCSCIVTNFEIGNSKVQILNLMVGANPSSAVLLGYLQKLMNSSTNCLICGDFGPSTNDLDCFRNLENSKLVLPVNILNHVHSRINIPKYCTSNFLLNTSLQSYFTGLHGVVRQGLTHLAIPSGWSWGGPVSSHCPIWAEFFVNSELNL